MTSAPGTGRGPIDVEAMALSGLAVPATGGHVRRVVPAGRPALTTEVRIAQPGGAELGDREIGEICVRGPSLMQGYVGEGAPDPFEDGWLQTGDMGYLVPTASST